MKIEIKAKNFEQALVLATEKTGKTLDELDITCVSEPGFLRKGVYSVSYEEPKEVVKPKENKQPKKEFKPEAKKEVKPEIKKEVKPEIKKTENENKKPVNNQKPEHKETKKVENENKKQPKPQKENVQNKENDTIKVTQNVKIVTENTTEEKTTEVVEEKQEYKVNPAELDHFVRNFIVEFAKAQGVEVEVEVEGQIRDGNKVYILTGDNAHKLIGYHGENLNAMQIIIGAVVSEKYSISTRILLDIEQYKAKREESLKALARRTARKVIQTRRSQKLEPMNANERRIIHSELQSNQKVTTESHGTEPHRFVVIKLK